MSDMVIGLRKKLKEVKAERNHAQKLLSERAAQESAKIQKLRDALTAVFHKHEETKLLLDEARIAMKRAEASAKKAYIARDKMRVQLARFDQLRHLLKEFVSGMSSWNSLPKSMV
jgi:methyl-accepting chemotaxis protein